MNKYILKNVKYIRNFLIVLGILSVIATITGIIIPYFNGVFVDVLIYTQDFNSIIKTYNAHYYNWSGGCCI